MGQVGQSRAQFQDDGAPFLLLAPNSAPDKEGHGLAQICTDTFA